MLTNLLIIAAVETPPATGPDFANRIGTVAVTAGLGLLVVWQIRQPLLSSLDRCPVRRHRFPFFFAFFQLFIWYFAMVLLTLIIKTMFKNQPEQTFQVVYNSAIGVLEIGFVAFFIVLIKYGFIRGLMGFGLKLKTVGRDFFWAIIHLLSVYPIILFALYATVAVADFFTNGKFEFPTHQTLIDIETSSCLWVRLLMIIPVIAIVPLFEEILFRGMIQSTLRGYLRNPWPAIVLTSLLFSAFHPGAHFLGIFALSMCLGYAYEKSGSLFRSYFVHALFNCINVVGVLLEINK